MSQLTSGQQSFAREFAHQTGLDPRVVGSWLLAEQSGSAAKNYEGKGYHNWLNIAQTDSGPAGGAHSDVWSNPVTAARASAEWMRGQGKIAKEYGAPSGGIQGILHTAGHGAASQIQAIAGSGWASSGYNGGSTLRQLYGQLGGEANNLKSAATGTVAKQAASEEPSTNQGPNQGRINVFRQLASITQGMATPLPEAPQSQITAPIARGAEPEEEQPKPLEEVIQPQDTSMDTVSKVWEDLANHFDQGSPIRAGLKGNELSDIGFANEGGAKSAVSFAARSIGHYAETKGANMGPELDKLEKTFGMQGEPWCAIFATTAVAHGGGSTAVRTASVAQINEWASKGSHGYMRGLKSPHEARPGDLLTFGSQHVAFVKEVRPTGIVTIEGNADGSGGVVQLFHGFGEGQIARPLY